MALLDVLKNTMANKPPAPAGQTAAATPTAGEVGGLLQAKATGKAAGPSAGPATSNIAAQMAGQTNQLAADAQATQQSQSLQQMGQEAVQGQKALNLQADTQNQQRQQAISGMQTDASIAGSQRAARETSATKRVSAEVQMKSDEISNRYANSLKDMASERKISENEIFSSFQQSIKELGVEKAASQLEQTAHALAMSDQAYLDEIQRIGQLNKLTDSQNFALEAKTLAFQKDLEILAERFDMERLINSDERDFQRQMAEMDINTALSLANQAAKESAATAIISGTVNAGTAIVGSKGFSDWFSGSSESAATPATTTKVSSSGLDTSKYHGR